MTKSEFAKMIDHTALKPDTTRDQIVQVCKEAHEYKFGAICVAPGWIPVAAETLAGSNIRIATVIGFPHGATLSKVKAYEATQALEAGADELDMVISIGVLKSGNQSAVFDDICSVAGCVRQWPSAILKVILETALLTDSEKALGCELAEKAGAHFVKTSTGFGNGGATPYDVELLRRLVGSRLGVKASGGIKDLETALTLIKAGANRLGCSSSVYLMHQFLENEASIEKQR